MQPGVAATRRRERPFVSRRRRASASAGATLKNELNFALTVEEAGTRPGRRHGQRCEGGAGSQGSSGEEGTGQEGGTCPEGCTSAQGRTRQAGAGQEGAGEEGTCQARTSEEGSCPQGCTRQKGAGEKGFPLGSLISNKGKLSTRPRGALASWGLVACG